MSYDFTIVSGGHAATGTADQSAAYKIVAGEIASDLTEAPAWMAAYLPNFPHATLAQAKDMTKQRGVSGEAWASLSPRPYEIV